MTEALAAAKNEHTVGRHGYRSGYYRRSLITRVGKAGTTHTAGSHGPVCRPSCSSVITAWVEENPEETLSFR
jgi:hypothetical protein